KRRQHPLADLQSGTQLGNVLGLEHLVVQAQSIVFTQGFQVQETCLVQIRGSVVQRSQQRAGSLSCFSSHCKSPIGSCQPPSYRGQLQSSRTCRRPAFAGQLFLDP